MPAKECYQCHQTVYTIPGKMNPYGKPQEYDDKEGTKEHFRNCPVRKAKYIAQQAAKQTAAAQTKTIESANIDKSMSFAGRETSTTYQPQGYINTPSTQQSANGGHLTVEPVTNSELAKDIKSIKETLGDLTNTVELIAIGLMESGINIKLPGREPKPLESSNSKNVVTEAHLGDMENP